MPTKAIDVPTMAVAESIDFAAGGTVTCRNTALMAGLQRAQEIAEEGSEWGAELVARLSRKQRGPLWCVRCGVD